MKVIISCILESTGLGAKTEEGELRKRERERTISRQERQGAATTIGALVLRDVCLAELAEICPSSSTLVLPATSQFTAESIGGHIGAR